MEKTIVYRECDFCESSDGSTYYLLQLPADLCPTCSNKMISLLWKMYGLKLTPEPNITQYESVLKNVHKQSTEINTQTSNGSD